MNAPLHYPVGSPFMANSTVRAINPGRMNAPPTLPRRGVINDARVNSRTGSDDAIHGK